MLQMSFFRNLSCIYFYKCNCLCYVRLNNFGVMAIFACKIIVYDFPLSLFYLNVMNRKISALSLTRNIIKKIMMSTSFFFLFAKFLQAFLIHKTKYQRNFQRISISLLFLDLSAQI